MTVLLGHQQGLEILTRNAQTIEDIESSIGEFNAIKSKKS